MVSAQEVAGSSPVGVRIFAFCVSNSEVSPSPFWLIHVATNVDIGGEKSPRAVILAGRSVFGPTGVKEATLVANRLPPRPWTVHADNIAWRAVVRTQHSRFASGPAACSLTCALPVPVVVATVGQSRGE